MKEKQEDPFKQEVKELMQEHINYLNRVRSKLDIHRDWVNSFSKHFEITTYIRFKK